MDKLTWLNGHYLKTLPEEDIANRLLPFLEKIGIRRKRRPACQDRRQSSRTREDPERNGADGGVFFPG